MEDESNKKDKKVQHDEKWFQQRLKEIKEKRDKKYNTGKGFRYSHMKFEDLVDVALKRDEEIIELLKEMSELKYKAKELEYRLKVYEPEKYDRPNYMGYEANWPNVRKIVFILKRNFQALTSSQVMQVLLTLEPAYKFAWRDPANSVSRLLSKACKHNLITRITSPGMGAPLYKAIRKE